MTAISHIAINISEQRLYLMQQELTVASYLVSTAKRGTGNTMGSEQTPLGWHCIAERIGDNCPINSVFVQRAASGEIYSASLAERYPTRDWVLTRILWLKGLEPGVNQGGQVDTYQRYIYIHGTPDTEPMGVPMSHGCIRMRNTEVIELFNTVTVDTRVLIHTGE